MYIYIYIYLFIRSTHSNNIYIHILYTHVYLYVALPKPLEHIQSPKNPQASVYGEAPPIDVIEKLDAIDARPPVSTRAGSEAEAKIDLRWLK